MVQLLFPDANTALVAVSIAASCAAAWMLYLLTRDWFGDGPALVAMLLFLFSPLGWFHGTVALTYIVEAFFSALVGYLCWRASCGESVFVLPASAVYALAAGFRPSGALLLLPLWLYSIRRQRGFRLVLAFAVTGAVALAWFLPMTAASGGPAAWFAAFAHLWATVPGRRTTLASPWLAVARILTVGWIFVLILGCAAVFALWPRIRTGAGRAPERAFLWAWFAPGLFFFSFVFLNFVNSGYLLVLCPPLFALAAARLYSFLHDGKHPLLRRAALVAGLAVNTAVFLYAPLYFSLRSVRAFESDLSAITRDFRTLDPSRTMILGFDAHFLGYRHAGYYLPAFLTVQYPEVSYPGGKRVFFLHDGETHVVSHLDTGTAREFVLFPLPQGGEYSDYLDKLRAKLPSGTLQTRTVGTRQVLWAPISALPLLLPETTR